LLLHENQVPLIAGIFLESGQCNNSNNG